ncbi:MAG: carboxypeptidase-like regulatory domain-containing protein [Bryobacteraceae bacterium]|nr:carboxypeptidase-like regulatory domain-containing protein [Bryobacteraceae bacterium]
MRVPGLMLGVLNVIAITFGQQPLHSPREKGSLQGRVVHAVTGEPVRKVTVTLVPQRPGSAPSLMNLRSVITAPDGAFSVDDLDPDHYTIVAYRLGFSRSYYGARRSGLAMPVEVKAGESPGNITIKLTPQSVLSGTLLDPDGDPAPGITVVAARFVYLQGERNLEPTGYDSTDDLGRFRIASLPAGRYYLVALSVRLPGEPEGTVATGPMFFPGVFAMDRASLLTLEPGQHLQGLNMTLRRISGVTVSGRILNLPPGEDSDVMIQVETRDPAGRLMEPSKEQAQVKDGKFAIRNLPPGSYLLKAGLLRGSGTAAHAVLEVGDHPIENVILDLREGAPVEGRLRWPGTAENEQKNRAVQITARYLPLPSLSKHAGVDSEGKFKLPGLQSGPYRLEIANLPAGMYVRSAKLGDDDVFENGLRPGEGGVVEVAISAGAAELRGSVRNAEEGPAAAATVVLIPARESPYRNLIRFAVADQHGAFLITGIVPGEYRVLAWEDADHGVWYDPDFREKHEAAAIRLVLRENGRKEIRLRAIPGN